MDKKAIEMDKVTLLIRGHEFTASKTNLSEHSDYFRAMFSGSYVENDQKKIQIDVLDPEIMNYILQFIMIGLLDLSEYSLDIIAELSHAANFLQITELLKQIEYTLYTQLSEKNWFKIMMIAERSAFKKLEQSAAAHGLLNFKHTKPESILTIQKLYWYLSHPYIDAETEFHIFQFGHKWIMLNHCGGDALLIVLCCLDYERLSVHDLNLMRGLMGNYTYSLAQKVVECLSDYTGGHTSYPEMFLACNKTTICNLYTEAVYNEMTCLIRTSVRRRLMLTPLLPLWKDEPGLPTHISSPPYFLYTFTEDTGYQKYIEVADGKLWGWSIVSWGLTKIVVVGGEYGRGTGKFMRDVRVYDTLTNEWTEHGVLLPNRRHAGVAILNDCLYLVGGIGSYRVVLDSVTVYDLRMRTHRSIAKFPEAIQFPAVCAHKNMIYASGQKHIYRYEDTGETDQWKLIVNTDIRASCMISFKGYIYLGQNYFCNLYKIDVSSLAKSLVNVTQFNNPPATMCDLGDRVIAITRTMCGHTEAMAVEEFNEFTDLSNRPVVVFCQQYPRLKINEVAGACALVLTLPPLNKEIINAYHRRHLSRFEVQHFPMQYNVKHNY